MNDIKTVMSHLEGLTWDDWNEYHSNSEVQNIAKEAMKLLEEQDERIQSLLQSIEDICCGGV